MKINIKTSNITLTPAISEYIQKKMDMVEKFLSKTEVIVCDFEIELTTNHHNKGEIFRAEVSLQITKELIWVDHTADDLYKAIDKVKDQLVDLIKKSKEKRLSNRRKAKKPL
jgi:putative sigma-54 modulation protein